MLLKATEVYMIPELNDLFQCAVRQRMLVAARSDPGLQPFCVQKLEEATEAGDLLANLSWIIDRAIADFDSGVADRRRATLGGDTTNPTPPQRAAMNTDDINSWVRKELAELTGATGEEIRPTSTLAGDLSMDSLDHYELMMFLEDDLGIVVLEGDIAAAQTVADLVALVEAKFAANCTTAARPDSLQ
jgi:acyl carrier protein